MCEDVLTNGDITPHPDNASDIHCILPGLYLTGIAGASELWKLKLLNIKAIVNCSDAANVFSERFEYLRIRLRDVESAPLLAHLNSVLEFIHSNLSGGKHVLVHCTQGMSRSVSFVVAYLIKYHGRSFAEALAHVQRARSCAMPNDGFQRQLQLFEVSMLLARTDAGSCVSSDCIFTGQTASC